MKCQMIGWYQLDHAAFNVPCVGH